MISPLLLTNSRRTARSPRRAIAGGHLVFSPAGAMKIIGGNAAHACAPATPPASTAAPLPCMAPSNIPTSDQTATRRRTCRSDSRQAEGWPTASRRPCLAISCDRAQSHVAHHRRDVAALPRPRAVRLLCANALVLQAPLRPLRTVARSPRAERDAGSRVGCATKARPSPPATEEAVDLRHHFGAARGAHRAHRGPDAAGGEGPHRGRGQRFCVGAAAGKDDDDDASEE